MKPSPALAAALLAVPLAGCSESATSSSAGTSSESATSSPSTTSEAASTSGPAATTPEATLNPADFVDRVTHPYLPLTPGARWVYAGTSTDGAQQIVVTVVSAPRTVAGVRTTVVHDVVRDEDGKVVEDTYDWDAQDTGGNVWYLGEDTTAYEDGTPNTGGSWETGVHGARAGIIMLAQPKVGAAYQQEWLKGVAQDRGRVLALDASVTVPAGTYTAVIQTEDTTPLEPDLVENKWYAKGIGVVQERDVHGGDERVVLLSRTP